MTDMWTQFIGLFLTLTGFIVGLGAVTVIDWHGFMGRKSSYWTEATTRTHKITKPLIWAGLVVTVIGWTILHASAPLTGIAFVQVFLFGMLVLNGLFLTFYISPYLLRREKEGKAAELLPADLQKAIAASFVVSFVGWWTEVLLLVWQLVAR